MIKDAVGNILEVGQQVAWSTGGGLNVGTVLEVFEGRRIGGSVKVHCPKTHQAGGERFARQVVRIITPEGYGEGSL